MKSNFFIILYALFCTQLHAQIPSYDSATDTVTQTSTKKIVPDTILIPIVLNEVSIIHNNGCNTNVSGWGTNLGTVSFVTDRIFPITNGITTQFWSDAVTATNCQKSNFDGGSVGNYNADCRSNPVPGRKYNTWLYGDLFSWCAVHRFKDLLCPKPWRVPTKQDFADLHIILGGTDDPVSPFSPTYDEYFNRWCANYNSGHCLPNGSISNYNTNKSVNYWSRSEYDVTHAYNLYIIEKTARISPSISYIQSQYRFSKNYGLTLRCVR